MLIQQFMKSQYLFLLLLQLAFFGVNAQTVLTPDEFEAKLAKTSNAQLIDVRTPTEYKDGHLFKSENIDYKSPAFKEQIAKLDKNKPVFVYCLGGVRSAGAAEILHQNGFTEIYDMKGGYMKWTAAEKKVDAPAPKNSAKSLTKVAFQNLTSSDQPVLIDFYAPWCAPCIKMLPIVHKLTDEYKGKVKIVTINYDDNKVLAKELGIDAIPAFLVYKNGKLSKRVDGELGESDFRKLLEEVQSK